MTYVSRGHVRTEVLSRLQLLPDAEQLKSLLVTQFEQLLLDTVLCDCMAAAHR